MLFLFMLLGSMEPARAATPMDYLHTSGPAADPVTRLNWGLLTISVAVCVIIAALILLAVFRRRAPLVADIDGRLPVGSARGGMPWLYVGVGISTVVLFASAIWTIMTLSAVAAPHQAPKLTVEVTGRQWWWEVRYLSDTPATTVITANEIHIPVGEPVRLKLVGGDVIHSFWIPQLAGKTDMIPGQINFGWLQADKPGDYRGQCGEYCGVQHAHMAVHVIAEDRPRFEAWRQQQLRGAATAREPLALRGNDVFMAHCSVCHSVRGTGASSWLGPDLTHLMSRHTIASGTLSNNTGNLAGWIADAQALKPGTRMPSMQLSPQDLRAVVAYLQTLQ
jgi:cytochrome c oxidase subunit II